MRVKINFVQTPVNIDIVTSSYQSEMFLIESRMVSPFQNIFNLLCPDPSEESLSMAAMTLRPIGCRMDAVFSYENADVYPYQNADIHSCESSWVTGYIVNEQ